MTTAEKPNAVRVQCFDDDERQEIVLDRTPPQNRWFVENGVAYSAFNNLALEAVFEQDGAVSVKLLEDGYYFGDAYVEDDAILGLDDFVDLWTPRRLRERIADELEAIAAAIEEEEAAKEIGKAGRFISGTITAIRITSTILFYTGKALILLAQVAWLILSAIFKLIDALVDEWNGTGGRRNRRSRPKFTTREKNALFSEQGPYCNGCGRRYAKKDLTVDHIIPLAHGGTERLGNLQLLCGNCNSIKGTGTQQELKRELRDRGIIR